jgi:hypothetical protein
VSVGKREELVDAKVSILINNHVIDNLGANINASVRRGLDDGVQLSSGDVVGLGYGLCLSVGIGLRLRLSVDIVLRIGLGRSQRIFQSFGVVDDIGGHIHVGSGQEACRRYDLSIRDGVSLNIRGGVRDRCGNRLRLK